MSEMTKILDYLANQAIKHEHADLSKRSTNTDEEKVSFMNSVRTLQVHADYLQRTTAWKAS